MKHSNYWQDDLDAKNFCDLKKDDSMEITGKLFSHQTNELLTEEALSNDNEWRLLRRLHLPDVFNEESSKNLKIGLFVDVETTGLSHQDDEIIELAMLPVDYDADSCEIHQV